MDIPNVFEFLDYRKFLTAVIEKQSRTKGFRALLASGAGCQRTYLSMALHGKVHLTPEHALGIAHRSFDR